MKITKVEYSKTFNLGNYQSAKIGFEAECEQMPDGELESPTGVLDRLKYLVAQEGAKLKQ